MKSLRFALIAASVLAASTLSAQPKKAAATPAPAAAVAATPAPAAAVSDTGAKKHRRTHKKSMMTPAQQDSAMKADSVKKAMKKGMSKSGMAKKTPPAPAK